MSKRGILDVTNMHERTENETQKRETSLSKTKEKKRVEEDKIIRPGCKLYRSLERRRHLE